MDDEPGPRIQFPFPIGQKVYHVAAAEPVVGIVLGFWVRSSVAGAAARDCRTGVIVVWGDDLQEGSHAPFELATEFEPRFDAG